MVKCRYTLSSPLVTWIKRSWENSYIYLTYKQSMKGKTEFYNKNRNKNRSNEFLRLLKLFDLHKQ